MKNFEDTNNSNDQLIDTRILKHLLHEAADLLEEAQTCALVEKPTAMTAHVLLQLNWRMTATSTWAMSKLHPHRGEGGQSDRLHAPAPIFSRDTEDLSEDMQSLVSRVNRLHERACRLDELSRGPTVTSAPVPQHMATTASASALPAPVEDGANVVQLFTEKAAPETIDNAVQSTQRQLTWMFGGRD